MNPNYWNDHYWTKHLETHNEKELDFLSDIWLEKYPDLFHKIPVGQALDLGCGLGQYTEYLIKKGFQVTSADISIEVLKKLKTRIPKAQIQQLDMSKPLPFSDNTFDLVLANLSIHYFNKATTISLLTEIKRVLKKNGYFIGTVNSTKTFQYIKECAKQIEPNFYFENGRTVRLWDKEQFDDFFQDFVLEHLIEVQTKRWDKQKIMWEFIAKNS